MKKVVLGIAMLAATVHATAQDASAQERAARLADIDFYTTKYIGDDIAYENVGCGKPSFPEAKTKLEIEKVSEGVASWHACYNGYVQRLSDLKPAGKALPADVQKVMTAEELATAKLRMAKVYDAVAADADDVARAVLAENEAWMASTKEFVVTENARLSDKKTQLDAMYRDIRRGQTSNGPGRAR